MKIESLELKNFMIFDSVNVSWSPGINVILGGNSTGKTTLLKAIYSLTKPYSSYRFQENTKLQQEEMLVKKILGVFRPDEARIGRLVSRKRGSGGTAKICVNSVEGDRVEVEFGNRRESHAEVKIQTPERPKEFESVYLPPKEMISATEHFQSLYEDYHIDFEETYYDLTKLLSKPLKKGNNTNTKKEILSKFENILQGNIIQKDRKFYLNVSGEGSFEMGLVSEGYRKLATIIYLIQSGSLSKGSILFWDEPETNMNPNMIEPIIQALGALAGAGVQVFITTHDYFTMQSLNLMAKHSKKSLAHVKFFSLYREKNGEIGLEEGDRLNQLDHNAIMEEFDELYNREQRLFYGD